MIVKPASHPRSQQPGHPSAKCSELGRWASIADRLKYADHPVRAQRNGKQRNSRAEQNGGSALVFRDTPLSPSVTLTIGIAASRPRVDVSDHFPGRVHARPMGA